MYDFSYKTSPVFKSHNFWNTTSWKYSLKDDSIRSSLIESLSNRKININPKYRVLMFLPSTMQVLCSTWCTEVNVFRIFMIFCLLDQEARRILFVSCLNSDLQVSIHC